MKPEPNSAQVDRAKTNFLSRRLAGLPVPTIPFDPKAGDNVQTAGIGAILRRANDGSLTPEEENTARSMISTMGEDILAAAEGDPASPLHGLAHRILKLYIEFAGSQP